MTKKKQPAFLLEKDQKIIVDELSNEEAGIIFKAIYEYEETREEPKLDKSLRIVFKQFKVKLDHYDQQYEQKCQTNKKNIQNYWDKVKQEDEYERIQSNSNVYKIKEKKKKEKKRKEKAGERDISIIRDSSLGRDESIISNKVSSSAPLTRTPTLSDVVDYGKQIGADEKYCEKFYDNYDGVGWVNANGLQIKNWKAVLRNWFKKDLEAGKTKDIRKKQIDPDRVLEDEQGRLYKQNYDGSRYYI